MGQEKSLSFPAWHAGRFKEIGATPSSATTWTIDAVTRNLLCRENSAFQPLASSCAPKLHQHEKTTIPVATKPIKLGFVGFDGSRSGPYGGIATRRGRRLHGDCTAAIRTVFR